MKFKPKHPANRSVPPRMLKPIGKCIFRSPKSVGKVKCAEGCSCSSGTPLFKCELLAVLTTIGNCTNKKTSQKCKNCPHEILPGTQGHANWIAAQAAKAQPPTETTPQDAPNAAASGTTP